VPTLIRPALLLLLLLGVVGPLGAQPKMLDDRLVLELVAREPDIVTPTGIAVDEQGRVWVIENHTHQRPKDYQGPATDRIRIFSDFDESGKARQISTFAEGFKNSMGLALGSDGRVFLATRSEIFVIRNKDGKAGEQRSLIKLDSTGDYPHNGLSGFAFDPQGNLCFGLGENLGAAYKLVGTDGTTLAGGGEGGSIYRCRPDGSGLTRLATGFWNPFHVGFDGFGRLFAVDNDPDERGPCRLVHVIPGGDYGYRFRYGRKGLHPFDSWDGELPGTLPMVAGTGEAPCGVLAYESSGLPAEYRGSLLVTSWGDHLIERFQLEARGASFSAQSKTIVRGGEDFRPVGIAVGPGGAIYFSDWVDKSYPVHGKGRIWRIRMKKPPEDDKLRPSQVAKLETGKLKELLGHPRLEIRLAASDALAKKGQAGKDAIKEVLDGKGETRARISAVWAAARLGEEGESLLARANNDSAAEVRAEAIRLRVEALAADPARRDESYLLESALKDAAPAVRGQAVLGLKARESLRAIVPLLGDKDPFLVSAALTVLGVPGQSALLLQHATESDSRLRLGVLLALRRTGDKDGTPLVPAFLKDADPEIRRTAIQWVAEAQLKDFGDLLAKAAEKEPTSRALFEALLAAEHLLKGGKPDAEPVDETRLLTIIEDAKQPAIFRALALQMIKPDHPRLTADRLKEFVKGKDEGLRRQAVRLLAQRADAGTQSVLRELAGDAAAEPAVRAEAVGGLAGSAVEEESTRTLLLRLLDDAALQRQALRSLRQTTGRPETLKALMKWWDVQTGSGAARGEQAAQLLLTLQGNAAPAAVEFRRRLAEAAGKRPADDTQWQAHLTKGGNAAAGEAVFFHANGPRCFVCHRIDGRGGKIGPDLSIIGRATSRAKLIESVLQPSKEIAPRYVSWNITMRDGKVLTGMIVDEGPNSTITLADGQGKLTTVHRQNVEERQAVQKSIMPDNLHELMTPAELLDLMAFLNERK
jgi:putative membrane-bound dehydrogenase-like protein